MVGDSLRAVGALGVFVYHAAYWTLVETGFRPSQRSNFDTFDTYGNVAGPLLEACGLGLFLFFALSGYLISRPFVRAFVTGGRPPVVGAYLRNRVLRLVPAMWVAFGVVLLAIGLRDASLHDVLGVLTFTTNWETNPFSRWFGQAWTLKVEMSFYLLVPLVGLALAMAGRRMSRGGRIGLVLAAAAAAWGISLLSIALKGPQEHSLTILGMGYAFMPGIALAAVEQVLAARVVGRTSMARLAAWVAGASLALLVAIPLLGAHFPSPMIVYVVTSAGVGCAVGGPLLRQWATGDAWRVLDNRVMRWLGRRSYSFYLFHLLLLVVLAPVTARMGGGYYGALAALIVLGGTASAIAAAISYRFVERPFLRRRSPAAHRPLPAHPPQPAPRRLQ
jgi:peptidoglycan/LPS O-acetylase OafA/YrhL